MLNPGVYDWIEIVTGRVVFNPGVYVIRGVNPLTRIGLNILAGRVTANGVMFYMTNSTGYSAGAGSPDSADGETVPAVPGLGSLLPSAVINIGLLGSQFTPLDDPSSPFDGMSIYQRRQDRRPIVILNDDLSVAFDAVQSIVKAERLRRDRRHGLFDFVTKLVTEKPVL